MITEKIREKINNFSTKEEVLEFIERVKVSSAPLEIRDEIIKHTQKIHMKLLGLESVDVYEDIINDIEASRADLDGFGDN